MRKMCIGTACGKLVSVLIIILIYYVGWLHYNFMIILALSVDYNTYIIQILYH